MKLFQLFCLLSGVTACLCTTSFCNVGDPVSGDPPPKVDAVKKEELRTTTLRTEVITTTRLAPQPRTTTPSPPRRTQPLQDQKPASVRLPQRKFDLSASFSIFCRLVEEIRSFFINAQIVDR